MFSSIAAFDRTLTTHRRSLAKKSEEIDADITELTPEPIEDNDSIDVATHYAKGELGDLKAAIAHVDRMLAIARANIALDTPVFEPVPVAARNAFQTLGFGHGIRRVDRWADLSLLSTGVTKSCHDIEPAWLKARTPVDLGSSYS